MRYLLFLVLIFFVSCENRSFESDKRQLTAKDEIRKQLRGARNFDITSFRQDTIENLPGITLTPLLQYTMDINYSDSSGQLQKKKGVVIFTPDGRSVLKSQILSQY